MRDGAAIGSISLGRKQTRPFSDEQVELLNTFADLAALAVENARLSTDVQEHLEQQSATSEILRVISSSPTDLQAVLDAVAENAARVCNATDALILRVQGNGVAVAAQHGSIPLAHTPGEAIPIRRDLTYGRAIMERRVVHVPDWFEESDQEFALAKEYAAKTGVRTALAAPMLRKGEAIGTILIRRAEPRPFTEKQIYLLQT